MLDQSFTAHHFNEIFQKERRKGNIRKDYFPPAYIDVLKEGHELNLVVRELKKTKRKEWTAEQKQQYKDTREQIKKNQEKRKVEETKWLEAITGKVNSRDFCIELTKVELNDGKDAFTVPENVENLFVMKTLQANLKSVFKVQQANRHRIMTQLKRLLNESTPKYIIRTDVHHFYESIPQAGLLKMIKDNTLLSRMSVRFIWQVLQEYEAKKDAAEPRGAGVPRGVGVSAYLSEIYMRDIDEKIKQRDEVVYYVRYVDDIFMILSRLPIGTTLEQYYDGIRKDFKEVGLKLMDPNDEEQKKKMQLLDFHTFMKEGDKNQQGNFTYLGYKIKWLRSKCDSGTKLMTTFTISDKKRKRIKERIDKAFEHFTEKTKYSLSEARKDLRDSLRFIAGNYRLTKSKSGVKAGIYYSNDLMTNPCDLRDLTYYLKRKEVVVYEEVMKGAPEREKYIESIKKMRDSFDFPKQWEAHRSYTLKDKRIREISQWL